MKTRVIVETILLAAVTLAHGADNNRKGFVTGIGLGIAPVCRLSVPGAKSGCEDGAGFGYSLFVGHGWGERDVVAFEINGAVRNSAYYSEIGGHTGYWTKPGVHGSQYLYQHLSGITWYHYLGDPGKSFVTAAGLGFFNQGTKSLGTNTPGLGTILGVGYEFARHYQVTIYWGRGESKDGGYRLRHSDLTILLTWVSY